jgi:hypothetical protein
MIKLKYISWTNNSLHGTNAWNSMDYVMNVKLKYDIDEIFYEYGLIIYHYPIEGFFKI